MYIGVAEPVPQNPELMKILAKHSGTEKIFGDLLELLDHISDRHLKAKQQQGYKATGAGTSC